MTAPAAEAPASAAKATRGDRVLRRLVRDPRAWFTALVLLVVVLVSILGPLIAPWPQGWSDVTQSMGPASAEHPLGLDRGGSDILSELIYATPESLFGMLIAVGVSMAIGIPSGLMAGYSRGRWFDNVTDWVANLLMAIPAILVLLVVRGLVGPSLALNMGVFGVMLSPAIYRVVRAATSGVRGELYVDAAWVNGLSTGRIIGSHILRVVRGPIIIQAAFMSALAIAMQAGLEFLGIGSQDTRTWGSMLNNGFREVYSDPTQILWPTLAVGLFCAAAVLGGNALTDAFGRPEPKRQRPTTGATTGIIFGADQPEVAGGAADPAPVKLAIRDLRIGYHNDSGMTEVVHGVDLDLHAGTVLGLVGESGSGKTQTILSVLGLLPSGGTVLEGSRIELDGDDLMGRSRAERRELLGRHIAYIPQEPLVNLDPSFKIGYQLHTPLRAVLGLSSADAKTRSLELLDRVGITDPQRVYDSYPHQISGGMAQRVLIAGAISCEPELLVADEPTTALDVTVQAEVLDLLRDLQRENGMTMLLVTHNFGVVADLCDEVAVMRKGMIVERGDVRTVLRSPSHPYTRALLGAMVENKPPLITPRRPAATERGIAHV
ncbi:dipeptide/oligopeptide/nickel ABC transporter ATP-binding protein [Pseudoclavibacter endophyticus]|uniref:Dipeptide/oligopeptide/nickel ABC transporter permease/ATP-binding protein n=1 Tax=Pseudoclavibacter endophyticus TaxID=1778590 RepID=A0A6H9WEP1_9MICO|nr:dipeptide/oligopeptide/nickel ABC transporter permease/ATP-binding protein [Pseudoclavibacter endophyticus]KAB1649379.1 dipeptide/oligopeptide/nickel ABC transporter permease/ATP-binding protein [Pseudoclavibacter endophyticus]GGA63091.1 dipeptide/oligopeptide/nickel ABC transporter ATP-binding protein [Pseudoclavibacter endophyticus]